MMSTCIVSLVHYDLDGAYKRCEIRLVGEGIQLLQVSRCQNLDESVTYITLIATRVRHQSHSKFGDNTVVGLGEKATASIC
jgi:hypothetical protein